MNGDAENDLQGAGEAPAPADQPASGGGDPLPPRKPFSNWGAAKREEPSLLKRTSQRLKSLFSRDKGAKDDVAEEPADTASDPVSDLPLLADHRDAEPEAVEPAIETVADIELTSAPDVGYQEPKEDLAFLRTGESEAVPAPEPKKAGLLGRLFSPRPKQTIPDQIDANVGDVSDIEVQRPVELAGGEPEAPVEAAAPEPSLDDVLPMGETDIDLGPPPPTPEELGLPSTDEPEQPKKPGFFARLIGRDKALDAADQGFASAGSEFAPPPAADAGFASVDDALPFEAPTAELVPESEAPAAPELAALDSTMDGMLAIPSPLTEATRPMDMAEIPAPPSQPVGAESAASYHSMPVYDFDTPKPDERSTREVDLPAAEPVDSRPTAEVTADVSAAAEHAQEEDRDTDEFAQIDFGETIAEDPNATQVEVRQPGFFKKLFTRTKEVTQVEAAVPPPPTANPTFLVTKFRTFYNEVVVYKNEKTEFTAGFSTAIMTDYTADLSPEQSAQSLSQRLHQMLELQLAEASWMGGEAHDLYPEAQYAMAVLADEMLTHMEWPGQSAWGAHHLELKVFKTAAADVEFFKRVDKLLKNGPQTVGTRDLARVYLLAIASGFRGKYRPFNLDRPLAEYRRRLYEFVYDGDALMLYADDRRIFPEAMSATVAGKGVKRFSMAQQWAAILVLLLAGYTIISHLAWTRVSADLKDIAGRVEQARTSSNNAPDSTPNGGGGR